MINNGDIFRQRSRLPSGLWHFISKKCVHWTYKWFARGNQVATGEFFSSLFCFFSDDAGHLVPLLFHVPYQFKLGAGPVQIVLFPVDGEIFVAV